MSGWPNLVRAVLVGLLNYGSETINICCFCCARNRSRRTNERTRRHRAYRAVNDSFLFKTAKPIDRNSTADLLKQTSLTSSSRVTEEAKSSHSKTTISFQHLEKKRTLTFVTKQVNFTSLSSCSNHEWLRLAIRQLFTHSLTHSRELIKLRTLEIPEEISLRSRLALHCSSPLQEAPFQLSPLIG